MGLRNDYEDFPYERHFVQVLTSNVNKLERKMQYPMTPEGHIKMHYAIVVTLLSWHDKGITRIIDI